MEGLDKERQLQTGEMVIIVAVLLMWAGEWKRGATGGGWPHGMGGIGRDLLVSSLTQVRQLPYISRHEKWLCPPAVRVQTQFSFDAEVCCQRFKAPRPSNTAGCAFQILPKKHKSRDLLRYLESRVWLGRTTASKH